MPDRPQTKFTWSGDAALAYQVFGDGSDLVYLPPMVASVDWIWQNPSYARFLRRLGSFARTIVIDRRGWGCSDRFPPGVEPVMEELVEDVLIVMDAANCARPTLIGMEESGFLAIETVATHPGLFSRLVLFQSSPVWSRKDDMPWEDTEEATLATIRSIERSASWDDWHRVFMRDQLPSIAGDAAELGWLANGSRANTPPGAVVSELRWLQQQDERHRLQDITVPTLLLHRPEAQTWSIESGRYMAERIPDATLVELPGADVYPWVGDWESVTNEIQEFVTGSRARPVVARSLATVLFTDVVSSTVHAVEQGDAAWHQLLERHNEILRGNLRKHHGTELGTAGDGFFATFESAAQAVDCAVDMTRDVQPLGIEIRAGVHIGEVERDGDELRGIAVHIGARVMSIAGPSEVLVSSTVKDLSTGSAVAFEDAGEHELKGVPDRWHLYRVVSGAA